MAILQSCISFSCTRSDIQREMVPWPVTFYILVLKSTKNKEGESPLVFVAHQFWSLFSSRLKLKLNHPVENDLVVLLKP